MNTHTFDSLYVDSGGRVGRPAAAREAEGLSCAPRTVTEGVQS